MKKFQGLQYVYLPTTTTKMKKKKKKKERLFIIPPSAKGSLCREPGNIKSLFLSIQRLLCPYSLNLIAFLKKI